MKNALQLLVSALAILLAAYLLPGVHIEGFLHALLVALVLALFNLLVKPLLIILTIPVTILTMGLFLIVINVGLILLAAELVPGFDIDGFWWALLFSMIMTFIRSILTAIAEPRRPYQG
ncbi:MAG TPA: phage holin family protein [Bacteroidales bacterium]|nr:phage holin family protein [Lentimicrobiaceae bacterium]HOH99160.1 phage holin family protein [Bacteroidales bacterium]